MKRSLTPRYDVETKVVYKDRHGRIQTGVVRDIEGKWRSYKTQPYLIYRLSHPTYANGHFYCGEENIIGMADR